MDFNNISNRLQKIYKSINAKYDTNIDNYVKVEHIKTSNGGEITLSFDNGITQEDLENKVMMIIHNIANIKDNLKNTLKSIGKDISTVENTINNSIHLQVVIDLCNQEKHGYPLQKLRRSKKDPKIENIRNGVTLTKGSTKGSFIFNPFTGENTQDGNLSTTITADILDKNLENLFSLDELIQESLNKWEILLQEYNLL